MTAERFIEELEEAYEKQLKPRQMPLYLDKLRRFSEPQLNDMLNKVLEEAKYLPKVSEIFKVASELGFMSVDLNSIKLHHWKESNCGMCHGEGRLAIFWEFYFEDRENGRVEIQRMSKVMQYVESLTYPPPKNQFRSLFRCKCLSGDAETIPKSWPKLSRATPTEREVWA